MGSDGGERDYCMHGTNSSYELNDYRGARNVWETSDRFQCGLEIHKKVQCTCSSLFRTVFEFCKTMNVGGGVSHAGHYGCASLIVRRRLLVDVFL